MRGRNHRVKEVEEAVNMGLRGALILSMTLALGAADASAQASAEYAGTTSAITGAGAKAGKKISFPASSKKGSRFLHLPSGVSESPAAATRQAWE